MTDGEGEELRRVIEGCWPALPKTVRDAYERPELVNSIWALMASRRVRRPSRLHVRLAAIDVHRMRTHYRSGQRHGDVFNASEQSTREPAETLDTESAEHGPRKNRVKPDELAPLERMPSRDARPENRAEFVDGLREIRRRFGSEGLLTFVLAKVLELRARDVVAVMDYEPDSALAKSIGANGA